MYAFVFLLVGMRLHMLLQAAWSFALVLARGPVLLVDVPTYEVVDLEVLVVDVPL